MLSVSPFAVERPCDQVNMVGILGLHCKGTTKLQSSQVGAEWLVQLGRMIRMRRPYKPLKAKSSEEIS